MGCFVHLIYRNKWGKIWRPVKRTGKWTDGCNIHTHCPVPRNMLKNYFKVALRNLWKNKGFSAINIIGLAAGLGVCLLIVLYVVDELSYDKYNAHADRIFRLDADISINKTQFTAAVSPWPMGPTLVKDYPQIQRMVRTKYQGDVLVKKGNAPIQDHRLVFADSTFFQVFTAAMLAGDPATALNEPKSIVIDETAARRYFNSTDIVGKTLEIDNGAICKITGVFRDFPSQSHFHFSFIRPLRDASQGNTDEWLSNNVTTYVLLQPGIGPDFLQSRLNAVIETYLYKQLFSELHTTAQDLQRTGNYCRYHPMRVTDIHLHSDKAGEIEANSNIQFVYVFSIVAALILLIACVNFMNLSTARSANRAKEVGIRKVAGSTRKDLIVQFLLESVLLSFLSLLVALGIALLLLPVFNQLSGKQLQAGMLFSIRFLPLLVLLVLLVGCLAGSYPAFYLSAFQPIQVLKGKIASGFKSSWLRSSLVVFQFTISIALIIGTLVIYNQLNFILHRPIGFDREQVLLLHNAFQVGPEIKTFRSDLLKISGVKNASISGDVPTAASGYDQNAWFRDASIDANRAVVLTNIYVDLDYIPTLGMQMAQGRNFSADFPTDSGGIIINEAAVALLGFKEPLKEKLYHSDDKNKPIACPILGVVKDFNYNTMHEKVGPLVMQLADNRGSIAVRLQPGNRSSVISQIRAKWQSMANGKPFDYTFMDYDFNKLYHAEQQTGAVFISFAVFAILIACLGLFGLVTYAAEQRTKEIGIRKVLGARIGTIVGLLSRDFTKLVIIATLIAFPLGWWAMNRWLQSFAYRVPISWWIFVVAGGAAIFIALLTVSLQTIRAAIANPVKSLRSE